MQLVMLALADTLNADGGVGKPVSCEPLPMKKLPEMLPVEVTLPVTLNVPSVPTLVRLEVTTDELSTVPVRLAALAVIAVLAAAVS